MVESVSLKEFGFNFLGPLIHTYISHVQKFLEQKPSKVYCLAREGYLLKESLLAVDSKMPIEYLYASRTFLFRITLSNKESWEFSLGHGFEGTMGQFFIARFGFTLEQVCSFLDNEQFTQSVCLPDDRDKIEAVLNENLTEIEQLISQSRSTYLAYLESIGLTKETSSQSLFLDVGYSGTIQKLLSLLLKSDTNGFYFITTDSDKTKSGSYSAYQHYVYKDKVKMGSGYILLDRSMFIESLLTSPDGQFVDIISSPLKPDSFEFCFGKRNYTQHHFEKLSLVFDGTIEAVKHFSSNQIKFEVEEIEFLFEQYVSKRNLLPSAAWPLFEFDDAISGFGNVNSMQFFGL